jgi:hypothetical protein
MKNYNLNIVESDGSDIQQNDFTFDNPPPPPDRHELITKN